MKISLRRRHAQSFTNGASNHETNYIDIFSEILNPEGHQNRISVSKVTAILLKGWILPIGGASSGEGLRLQPAQQACLDKFNK